MTLINQEPCLGKAYCWDVLGWTVSWTGQSLLLSSYTCSTVWYNGSNQAIYCKFKLPLCSIHSEQNGTGRPTQQPECRATNYTNISLTPASPAVFYKMKLVNSLQRCKMDMPLDAPPRQKWPVIPPAPHVLQHPNISCSFGVIKHFVWTVPGWYEFGYWRHQLAICDTTSKMSPGPLGLLAHPRKICMHSSKSFMPTDNFHVLISDYNCKIKQNRFEFLCQLSGKDTKFDSSLNLTLKLGLICIANKL